MEDAHLPPSDQPPADADDWSNDQWIDWLNETDAAFESGGSLSPVTAGARIAHSSGGRMLGQAMVTLGQVIYGYTEERPPIVIGANGKPEDDQQLRVHLDPDEPDQSYAIMRTEPPEPDSA